MQVGDRVVIRKNIPANWDDQGDVPAIICAPIPYSDSWTSGMDGAIGDTYTIDYIRSSHGIVRFKEIGCTWPISAITVQYNNISFEQN